MSLPTIQRIVEALRPTLRWWPLLLAVVMLGCVATQQAPQPTYYDRPAGWGTIVRLALLP